MSYLPELYNTTDPIEKHPQTLLSIAVRMLLVRAYLAKALLLQELHYPGSSTLPGPVLAYCRLRWVDLARGEIARQALLSCC